MDYCKKRKLSERPIQAYIKDHYHSKRIYAKAFDGAMVPITLVYKISLKNTTGGNPLLLHGYGAYGSLTQAIFSNELLSLLDRGFIYAIAHVRGELTLGWDWYQQGKFFSKKNTFTDFIACAEHLINEEYTTSEKLAIHGKSAGGMMVLAVANMRPDLFKAVVADVPFVDVFNAVIDPTQPFTQFEWDELGNPRDSDELCRYILSYSPYNNIETKSYPQMLITAGLMDTRVSFAGPAKLTAKLRKLKTDDNVLLLKTYIAGHLGASGRFDAYEQLAFQYAFLIDTLGIASAVTASKPLLQVSPVAVTPPDLLAMFQGYQITMIVCAALDLGLFNELHRRPDFEADAQSLADSIGVNVKGLKRVLDALVATGILNKQENDNYVLTEISVTHLVKGMPGYIGDLRLTVSNRRQWYLMADLAAVLKQPRKQPDGPVLPSSYPSPSPPPSPKANPSTSSSENNNNSPMLSRLSLPSSSPTQALDNGSAFRHAAFELLSALSSWASRRKTLSILDLSCGNGLFGFTMLTLRHNAHVWSLDSPTRLANAKLYAQDMNIMNRVHFIEMEDFIHQSEGWGGPYDLIIVGQNLFNTIGYNAGATLLHQISDSLKSTGRVVLYEAVISDADSEPFPYFLSVLMFAEGQKGKVHDEQWYRDLLTETGFVNPSIVNLTPFPEKLLISYRNIVSHAKPKKAK